MLVSHGMIIHNLREATGLLNVHKRYRKREEGITTVYDLARPNPKNYIRKRDVKRLLLSVKLNRQNFESLLLKPLILSKKCSNLLNRQDYARTARETCHSC
jgi:hypothetical protein